MGVLGVWVLTYLEECGMVRVEVMRGEKAGELQKLWKRVLSSSKR